jgi:hypothetical protein
LRPVIDIDDAEALGVAKCPFEIIQKGPDEVPPQINALLNGRVGTGGSKLEYIGEARTAQLQDKKIGKMGQVPLPNEKSELLNCSGQGYNNASSSYGPCA